MIKEFAPTDLPESVHEALAGDGAVVRGLIDPERARLMCELVPPTGRQRVYLNPALARSPDLKIPLLDRMRSAIKRVVTERLGRSATFWGTYVMRPDILRVGQSGRHMDGRGTIVSGSLNLEPGDERETTFFARRLTACDAPYSEIEATGKKHGDISYEEMNRCTLGVGDMVIISRGIIHGSLASSDRKSITYRTRGIVPGDFE